MAKGAFSPAVREVVLERCDGLCERCGMALATDLHHRRPRGMGGDSRPDTGHAVNALALCRPCHSWVEGNRVEALSAGYLVKKLGNPDDVPVLYRGEWRLLSEM